MRTKESIENSLEFRTAFKLLKRRFPFVKNIELTNDWDNYSSLLFIDVTVDVDSLVKKYDIQLRPVSKYNIVYGVTAYLTMLVRAVQEDTDKLRDIESEMADILNKLNLSPALPDDGRLPKRLAISGWRNANVQS